MTVPEPKELKEIVHQMRWNSIPKSAICHVLFERYDLKWHEIAFAMGLQKQVDVDRLKQQHRKLIRSNEEYQTIYNQIK
jgi:hypothetical protein